MACSTIEAREEQVCSTGQPVSNRIEAKIGYLEMAIVSRRFSNDLLYARENRCQAIYSYNQKIDALGHRGIISTENITPTQV